MARKILIVDDEQRYCDLLRRTLEKDGWVAATAGDGAEGRRLLGWGGFDLLITDLDMPGLTGFDLVAAAQKLSAPPALLVITAQKAMLESAGRSLSGVHCLLKPFTLADLRAKVALLTDQWRQEPREQAQIVPQPCEA